MTGISLKVVPTDTGCADACIMVAVQTRGGTLLTGFVCSVQKKPPVALLAGILVITSDAPPAVMHGITSPKFQGVGEIYLAEKT